MNVVKVNDWTIETEEYNHRLLLRHSSREFQPFLVLPAEARLLAAALVAAAEETERSR